MTTPLPTDARPVGFAESGTLTNTNLAWTIASGKTVTVSTPVSGTLGVSTRTITVNGTLLVDNSGSLTLAAPTTIGSTGALTVNSGGTLGASTSITNGGTATVNGTLQLNTGGSISAAPTYGSSSALVYAGAQF